MPDSTHVGGVSSPARKGGGESVVALWSRPERGEVQGRGPSCPREEQEATCPGPQDTPGQG